MNARLQQFLAAENISQAQFAETIGVARASVSHILAGRNKPGFDFLESMVRHYPSLNLEWLLTGHGRMYNSGKSASDVPVEPITPLSSQVQDSLFPEPDYRPETPVRPAVQRQNTFSDELSKVSQLANNQRAISKIIVFYTDGSFQEIE